MVRELQADLPDRAGLGGTSGGEQKITGGSGGWGWMGVENGAGVRKNPGWVSNTYPNHRRLSVSHPGSRTRAGASQTSGDSRCEVRSLVCRLGRTGRLLKSDSAGVPSPSPFLLPSGGGSRRRRAQRAAGILRMEEKGQSRGGSNCVDGAPLPLVPTSGQGSGHSCPGTCPPLPANPLS